jgi:hypothetical protein
MSELLVLTRRGAIALLAAILMASASPGWSKDGDSGGSGSSGSSADSGSSGSGGGDNDSSGPGGGEGDSSGHGGGDDDGDGDNSGPGNRDDDDDDEDNRGRGGDHEEDEDADLSDQDYARREVERGEMVPLSRVLRTVRAAKPGRVVDIDLVRRTGTGSVYLIVVMGFDADLWQVSVDARRNTILKMRRF